MDISVLLWFQGLRELLGEFFEFVSVYFSDILAYSSVLIPFLFYWNIDKEKGRFMILSLCTGMYLTHLLKLFFHIPRPWVRDARIQPSRQAIHGASGYSFPSSHTEIAASNYSALGTAVPKFCKVCIVMIILTGLSRMFLGVHTPQDVLAAVCTALFSVFCAYILVLKSKKNKYDERLLWAGAVLLALAGVLYALMRQAEGENIVNAMLITGVFAGVCPGFLLEERFVGFSPEGSRKEKWIRFLAGIAGTAAIALPHRIISVPFLPQEWFAFMSGFLAVLFAVPVYPYILVKIHDRKKKEEEIWED